MDSFLNQVQKKYQVVNTRYEVRNTGFRLMLNAERPMQNVELVHFLPDAGRYLVLSTNFRLCFQLKLSVAHIRNPLSIRRPTVYIDGSLPSKKHRGQVPTLPSIQVKNPKLYLFTKWMGSFLIL